MGGEARETSYRFPALPAMPWRAAAPGPQEAPAGHPVAMPSLGTSLHPCAHHPIGVFWVATLSHRNHRESRLAAITGQVKALTQVS